MSVIQCALVGGALSMDAFAAAVCQGLSMEDNRWRQGLAVALCFGGFQGLMPLLGWRLGGRFAHQVEAVGHWIAWGLLSYLGMQMMIQSRQEDVPSEKMHYLQLLGLAVATSVDAFAVGVSFAFLQVEIVPVALLIACITLCLSWIGVMAGHALGVSYRWKAQCAGGILLCLLGISIVLRHIIENNH